MSVEWYDQDRFAQEWAADQDVLASLRSQGDRTSQIRAVDVSVRGHRGDLASVETHAVECGFEPIELVEFDTGEWRLTVSRQQTAEPQAIKHLTITALQIEAAFGVVYDGWGCITQNSKA